MIRVRDFEMDGVKLKIASMSTREARQFVKEGTELLERVKRQGSSSEAWLTRRDMAVIASLNKAGASPEWTSEKLEEEFDLPLLDAVYSAILEFSGLKLGEAVAASASPKSTAA
jgi:hypothetical protein